MKNVEERLRALPDIAASSGLQADEQLKRRILRAAERNDRKPVFQVKRLVPAFCALVVLVGGIAFALPQSGKAAAEGRLKRALALVPPFSDNDVA